MSLVLTVDPQPVISTGLTPAAKTTVIQIGIPGIQGPAGSVLTVAGRSGNVVLSNSDVSGSAPSTSPSFAGTVTLTASSPVIAMTGTGGVNIPSFSTRSSGTKLVLFGSGMDASNAEYALGISTNTLWNSVPSTSRNFAWYAGTTNIATLAGSGSLTLTGSLAATSASFSNTVSVNAGANVTGALVLGNAGQTVGQARLIQDSASDFFYLQVGGGSDDNGRLRITRLNSTTSPIDALEIYSSGTTISGNLSVGGSTVISGPLQRGSKSSEYNAKFVPDTSWKKIADVTLPGTTFAGMCVAVDIISSRTNHAATAANYRASFLVRASRSQAVIDDTDSGQVAGPVAEFCRLVKTALGVYEIQVRSDATATTLEVTARVVANASGTLVWASTSPANGSTVGTVYLPDPSLDQRDYLTQLRVGGTTASTSTTTGAAVVAGGMGISGALNVGGTLNVPLISGSPTVNPGILTLDSTTGQSYLNVYPQDGQDGMVRFTRSSGVRWNVIMENETESGGNAGSTLRFSRFADDGSTKLGDSLNISRATGVVTFEAAPKVNSDTIWHSGNDGPASGLDADLLDGMQTNAGASSNTVVYRDSNGWFGTSALTAYSATNDGTAATVRFGRDDGQYLAIHGQSSGSFLTAKSTDANPKPLALAVRTDSTTATYTFNPNGRFDSASMMIGTGDATAAPAGGAIRAVNAVGTNIAGASMTLQGGASTGSASGGSIFLQAAGAGTSGTGTNAPATQLQIIGTAAADIPVTITGGKTSTSRPVISTGSGGAGFDIANGSANPVHVKTAGNTEQLRVSHTNAAVNYVQVTGSAGTAAVTVSAQGTATDLDLALSPKGSGAVTMPAAKISGGTTIICPTDSTKSRRMQVAADGALSLYSTDNTSVDFISTPGGDFVIRGTPSAYFGGGVQQTLAPVYTPTVLTSGQTVDLTALYPLARAFEIEGWGPAGGGGGGARVVSGANCSGGGAGGGAGYDFTRLLSSEITGSLTVTVGTGGAGGAGATVDGTAGGNGSPGSGATTVTMGGATLLRAHLGGGGAGGQPAAVSGGGGGGGKFNAGGSSTGSTGGALGSPHGGGGGAGVQGGFPSNLYGGAGGSGGALGASGVGGSCGGRGGCGGGSGGGISIAPAHFGGGFGLSPASMAGPAGASGGGNAPNGAAVPGSCGFSGGGGGSNIAGAGGSGGNGGMGSGGGGGGGAVGGNGGAGGTGGNGSVRIVPIL